MGTKIIATMSIILRVRGLDEALKAVRLHSRLRLEGNIAGKSPMTPKNVEARMEIAQENHAFQ